MNPHQRVQIWSVGTGPHWFRSPVGLFTLTGGGEAPNVCGDATLLNLDKQDLLQSHRTFIHELKKFLISTNVIKLIEFCFHEVTLILINIDIGSSVRPLLLVQMVLLCHINAYITAGACLGFLFLVLLLIIHQGLKDGWARSPGEDL